MDRQRFVPSRIECDGIIIIFIQFIICGLFPIFAGVKGDIRSSSECLEGCHVLSNDLLKISMAFYMESR